MRFTHTFIDRPILATVLSVFVTLIGLGALVILPVAQYPEIVPPTVQITTNYPGASAETVARTVATPLEQQINGVENMLYMSSQSTGDGKLTVTVTFRIGTDLNVAQMLTQNRVQDTLPRLPDDVQRLGVQVRKATPSILLAIHLYSPDKSRDTLYLSNYATLRVKERWRGCKASAMCSSRAPASMRCASGSIRTKWRHTISMPARCSPRSAPKICKSRPGSSISLQFRATRPIKSTSRRSAVCRALSNLRTSLSNPIPGTGYAHPRHRPRRGRRRRLREHGLHGS